jgi:hypothetical protein
LAGAGAGQRFNFTIRKENLQALATALVAASGVVLVSWEHTLIHAAVSALPNAPATPEKWPGDRFDVVWILKAKPGGWDFETPTDRDAVIPFSR